jgi:tetratricopeptide (TPR) repeat protein
VGVALGNIAGTYAIEGRYEEAAAFYSRALRQLEHSVGSDDRRTLNALSGYAWTVAARGDYGRAEKLWHILLSRFEKSFGVKHAETLGVVMHLASMYVAQSKAECISLYERAVSDATESLGTYHPLAVTAINGLSNCLVMLRRDKEAIDKRSVFCLFAAHSPGGVLKYRRRQHLRH